MNVHNAAAEQQRHARPRQDEAVTEVTQAQLSGILKDLFVVQSVDEGCGERCETWEHKRVTRVRIYPRHTLG